MAYSAGSMICDAYNTALLIVTRVLLLLLLLLLQVGLLLCEALECL
jgi:hypothetical protein